jgi:molybdopterin-containing oxidoreductase family iron-sulfur binding subunit
MDDSRRDFLKKASIASLGIAALPVLSAGVRAVSEHTASTSLQWGMVIDIEKCDNTALAAAAQKACHTEHNVPTVPEALKEEEIKWIWTEAFPNVFPEQAHAHMAGKLSEKQVMVLCNHCARPSCVRVCPTKATWKRQSDGIVMMDMHRCIGCRFCMAACPFGARSFNFSDPRKYMDKDKPANTTYPTRSMGVVEKCNFCADRLREGRLPACVEAANAIVPGAMLFGNVNDENSEIYQYLQNNHTVVRQLNLGTGPSVYYKV